MEIPAVRSRFVRSQEIQEWEREENRVRQARQEVERARQDVAGLLEELDRASEKVVNIVAGYAVQAKENQLQALEQVGAASHAGEQPRLTNPEPPIPQSPPKPPRRSPESSTGKAKQPTASSGRKKKTSDTKYQTVYDLASQGLSVDEIAHTAKLGKGEVELLLELKNRGGNR